MRNDFFSFRFLKHSTLSFNYICRKVVKNIVTTSILCIYNYMVGQNEFWKSKQFPLRWESQGDNRVGKIPIICCKACYAEKFSIFHFYCATSD